MAQQYLDHGKEILTNPRSNFKGGSKGAGIISLFGHQSVYDLNEGFPLLTSKQMAKKSMFTELLWFIKGDTNIKYLEDNGCRVWRDDVFNYNLDKMVREGIFPSGMVKYSPEWASAKDEYGKRIKEDLEFAKKWGDAGPIYPEQWRSWPKFVLVDEEKQLYEKVKGGVDQLRAMIEGLKKKPTGKKHIVSAWNAADLKEMSLPPCHVMFQATGNENGELELQLYQRSCDQFLGVPFNTAAYVALTHIIAKEAGMTPKTFVHTFGDSHFYASIGKRTQWHKENFEETREKIGNAKDLENKTGDKSGYLEAKEWINKNAPADGNEENYDHVTAILEQLSRDPLERSKLILPDKAFEELTPMDLVNSVKDYKSQGKISRKMCV